MFTLMGLQLAILCVIEILYVYSVIGELTQSGKT